MMWWAPSGGMGGGAWVAMAVGMVLFWGVIITGAVLLVHTLNHPGGVHGSGPRPSPEHLLAERFARGEIDEQEYERRRATLSSASSGYASQP
jgi:putative membrane protein